MTEAEFEDSLIEAGRMLGFMAHAQRPARTRQGWTTAIKGDRGWPDVTLVGYGQMFVFELKAKGGRLRDGQQEWVDALDAVPGVTARVVWPDDIEDVIEMLTDARRVAMRAKP